MTKILAILLMTVGTAYAAPKPDSSYDPYKSVMHWADSVAQANDDPDFYREEWEHYHFWGPLSRIIQPTVWNGDNIPFGGEIDLATDAQRKRGHPLL